MQQFYLSISQPFITVRSMVMLPHLDRSMLGIAIVLLNGLKFIKEFLKNFFFFMQLAIFAPVCVGRPQCKNILLGTSCKGRR
jgi:hypothetical protein